MNYNTQHQFYCGVDLHATSESVLGRHRLPSGALTVMGRGMSKKSKGVNAEVPLGKLDLPIQNHPGAACQ